MTLDISRQIELEAYIKKIRKNATPHPPKHFGLVLDTLNSLNKTKQKTTGLYQKHHSYTLHSNPSYTFKIKAEQSSLVEPLTNPIVWQLQMKTFFWRYDRSRNKPGTFHNFIG